MWIDSRVEFVDSQAFTASAALTNHINLGGDFDIGPGTQLWAVFNVDVTSTGAYTVAIQTDDNNSFSSATTIASMAIASGTVAGTKFVIGFPFANEQFVRAYATRTGGNITLTAWLTDQHPSAWAALPDNVPV